jgi:hypothetical protein
MIENINSLEDINSFVRKIINEGVNFHPDDDFNDMINFENKTLLYSKTEANERNKLNEQCFEYCEFNNLDYYTIALEVFKKETGLNNVESDV